MLTVSVLADPANDFPFFAGFADETGMGAGDGFSLNFPLPPGAGDYGWLAAIEQGMARILSHRPAAMVSALGLDAA